MASYRDIGAFQQASGPDIGAFESAEAAGGLSIPIAMHHYKQMAMAVIFILLWVL